MINVTKSFMPKRAKFDNYVDKIWENTWLTNHGPLVQELEKKLTNLFGVRHVMLVNNGTIALQIALKSLGCENGEIITTPFTYIATTSSIVWEGLTPVFVDIEPDTLTIDPKKIERAITKKTKAILAVHVYGISCNIEEINRIAKKHGLRVIYDAAHSFGVKYKNKSVLSKGDVSTLSFHATKLFHTIEGGAIITNNDDLAHKISYMRNFGHKTATSFYGVGINGKMNEFSAAMGLAILDSIPKVVESRKKIVKTYDKLLLENNKISRPKIDYNGYNFSYYPIKFSNEKTLLKVVDTLNQENIFPRRYFFPSLSKLPYVKSKEMQVSEDIAPRVLCLPLYPGLKTESVKKICKIVVNSL